MSDKPNSKIATVVSKNGRSAHGFLGAVTRSVLRLFQFALGIAVIGLYAQDLQHAAQAGVYMDARWVFAVVTGSLSAITCLVYGVLFCLPSEFFFVWDWILFILWITVFGIFGKLYIPFQPTPEQHGQIRMKRAVWVDLANMLLWLVTAAYATWLFLRRRKASGASKA